MAWLWPVLYLPIAAERAAFLWIKCCVRPRWVRLQLRDALRNAAIKKRWDTAIKRLQRHDKSDKSASNGDKWCDAEPVNRSTLTTTTRHERPEKVASGISVLEPATPFVGPVGDVGVRHRRRRQEDQYVSIAADLEPFLDEKKTNEHHRFFL